ncbi:hypothetical protein [Pseudomonas sp.]|uniref:hypothetical protein n=1 Tax=Pseudomonas sp. TaxID=306 RepID=UPI003981D2DC
MASSKHEEHSSASGEQKKHPDSSDTKAGIFKKSASIILATKTIKANLAASKERLSFPLLRRVISQKLAQEKFRPFKDVDTEDLHSSAKNHLLMIFLMFPILFWSTIIFARGLGALVRFSEFSTWLIYGALLVIISAVHLFKSSTSRRNALAELARRNLK